MYTIQLNYPPKNKNNTIISGKIIDKNAQLKTVNIAFVGDLWYFIMVDVKGE